MLILIKYFSIYVILSLLSITHAFAYCSEPIAPEPPGVFTKPTKPTVPFCVNEIMNTHTCDDWEISSYNSEVSSYRSDVNFYVQQLKNYISDAELFLNESVAYAKCEIRTLN